MIALRAGDGRFVLVSEPPDGDAPGEWRGTGGPASVTPWTAHVRPFLVNSPDQFRPDGPNALTSSDYAEQWDEVRRLGAATGSERSPQQTEIARFWTENTLGQYNRAFRRLSRQRGLSAGQAARLFAMTSLTAADGMITCWNTKYHYLFWRPITAIREADADGNPATTAVPAWAPLSTTANHPEYTQRSCMPDRGRHPSAAGLPGDGAHRDAPWTRRHPARLPTISAPSVSSGARWRTPGSTAATTFAWAGPTARRPAITSPNGRSSGSSWRAEPAAV